MLTRRDTFRTAAAGFGILRAQRPPNIVALVADDLSAPYLACYGDPAIRTPNLDRLAAEGMRFNRAYVTSPQCSPSRSSVFTGRTPHATGCSRLHAPLRPNQPTFLEPLRAKGYFAGAFRKHHMGEEFARRLDFYGGAQEPFGTFFEKAAGKPFFLWAGFTQPHRPYRPGMADPPHDPGSVRVPAFLPDTPVIRKDLALHYDAVNQLDRLCGEVLELIERSGEKDNTIVVFFGDNGMPYPRAKASLYQPGVRVPLIVRWPERIRPGSVSDELVSTVDLSATFLAAADAQPLEASEGLDLTGLLTGSDRPWGRARVFTERNWHDTWDPMRSIVTKRYSLICNYRPEVSYRGTLDHVAASWSRGGGPAWDELVKAHKAGRLAAPLRALFRAPRPALELYDLEKDPDEFVNLAGSADAQPALETLQRELATWMQETNDFLPPPAQSGPRAPDAVPGIELLLDGYLSKGEIER